MFHRQLQLVWDSPLQNLRASEGIFGGRERWQIWRKVPNLTLTISFGRRFLVISASVELAGEAGAGGRELFAIQAGLR